MKKLGAAVSQDGQRLRAVGLWRLGLRWLWGLIDPTFAVSKWDEIFRPPEHKSCRSMASIGLTSESPPGQHPGAKLLLRTYPRQVWGCYSRSPHVTWAWDSDRADVGLESSRTIGLGCLDSPCVQEACGAARLTVFLTSFWTYKFLVSSLLTWACLS